MFYDDNIQNNVEENEDENVRKLKISAYSKTAGKDKLKKEADEEHFEEQTELLDNQVKKEESKVSLKKEQNKILLNKPLNSFSSGTTEKSVVPDNAIERNTDAVQKREFAYKSFVLAKRKKRHFKHSSQEQQFKFDQHRDLIIKQRRDFAYKQSYKDKLDDRHTYYAELVAKTAKEAYERFRNQDEDAASESRGQSLGDMANDQVRHTVNSVSSTVNDAVKSVAEQKIRKQFSANQANRQNYIYNNEATFSYKSEKAIEKSAGQVSKEAAKKAAMKKAAQKKAAEEAAKKASEEAAKKAAAVAAAKGVAAGSGAAAAGSGAAAAGSGAAAAGATAGTPVGLIIAAAAAIIVVVFIILIIVIILVIAAAFPFHYVTTEEEVIDDEGNVSVVEHHEEQEVGFVLQHYHNVIDNLINKFNTDVIDAVFASASDYNNSGVPNPEVQAQYEKDKASYDLWLNDDNAWWDAYGDAYIAGEIPYPSDPGSASDYPGYYYTEEEIYRAGGRRGPIFEGVMWAEDTDGTKVPLGKIYNEVLAALATYNVKCWNEEPEEPVETEAPEETDPPEETEGGDEADESGYPPIKFEYLNDDTVSGFYEGMKFWEFTTEEITIDCEADGQCCMEVVTVTIYDSEGIEIGTAKQDKPYCPGHWAIECKLKLNFNMDMVFDRLGFNSEDMDLYDDELTEINKNS